MIVAVLAGILFFIAALTYRIPVGYCEQCSHCRSDRTRKKEEEGRRSREYAAKNGITSARYGCPQCGVDHHLDDDSHK